MNPNLRNRKRKFLPVIFIGAFLILPLVVMLLWNNILPTVIGVKTITYLQAMGIFILSKILFGGFRFRNPNQNHRMKKHFKDHFLKMNDQEREIFKQKWKEHCKK